MQFDNATNLDRKSGLPRFPARGTSREQLGAAFFTESRMQLDGTTKLHRKSGLPRFPARGT
jgi:hypothetical protein